MKTSGYSVRGIAATTPSEREDNLSLTLLDEPQRKKLVDTTGIRYRYIARQETASQLCEHAAVRLLEALSWDPETVDLLVVVTQTPDLPVPGPASQLQHRLGLRESTLVLDLNQGCAGYVYGLSVVTGMMQSLGFRRALLLVGDTITQHISADNAGLRPIFSDAGTATALEKDPGSEIQFGFGVKGEHYQTICLPPIGSDLVMNGHNVFSFGLKEVSNGLRQLLEDYEKKPDFLVMHQANKLLNDALARKLGFDEDKVPSSHYEYGNTSSATIPLTIVAKLGNTAFTEEQVVMLAGFGVGLTWGGAILTMKNITCLPVEQL